MPEYAPHGNYEIALDRDHDRVIRIAASGSVNFEMLRIHNDRANAIVAGFKGRTYGMVCDFNGGMLMTPDAEDAWIKSAAGRVARGWLCVAYYFDESADYTSLVHAQLTRVFEGIGVNWYAAKDDADATSWVLARLAAVERD